MVDVATSNLVATTFNVVNAVATRYAAAYVERKNFKYRLGCLKEKHHQWKQLAERYGTAVPESLLIQLDQITKRIKYELETLDREEQKTCLPRIWRKIKLTALPGTLSAEVEAAYSALNSIFEIVTQDDAIVKALEEKVLCTPSRFPFGPNKRYVPLKMTEARIRQELEKKSIDSHSPYRSTTRARVVLLYGATGTGKSLLAKHVGWRYSHKREKLQSQRFLASTSEPKKQPFFQDGVFYLHCGPKSITMPEAEIRIKQFELLQLLGFPFLRTSSEQTDSSCSSSSKSLSDAIVLRKRLENYLRNRSMLIVLDDVWGGDFLYHMLIPGKDVTYLVTSQKEDLLRDAPGIEVVRIPIERVGREDARSILASHLDMPNNQIPPHLENIWNTIASVTHNHPLALANVAIGINTKRREDPFEWGYAAQDVYNELKDPEPHVNGVGISGVPNLRASMKLAVEFISENAQDVLALASMFQSRSMVELVVEVLHARTQLIRGKEPRFSVAKNELENSNLLDILCQPQPWCSAQSPKVWIWSIHGLRKTFVRKHFEARIKEFVDALVGASADCCDKWVLTLCALYGDSELLAESAKRKLNIGEIRYFSNIHKTIVEPLVFANLLNGREEHFLRSISNGFRGVNSRETTGVDHSVIARDVILNYVTTGEIDQEQMICLLGDSAMTIFAGWTLKGWLGFREINGQAKVHEITAGTLKNLSSIDPNKEKICSSPRALSNIEALLRKGEVNTLELTLGTLKNLVAADGDNGRKNRRRVLKCTNILDCLVHLLFKNKHPTLQDGAAEVLMWLAKDPDNQLIIGGFRGCLNGLVALLQEEEIQAKEDSDSPGKPLVQRACDFGQLCSPIGDSGSISRCMHVVESHAFHALVNLAMASENRQKLLPFIIRKSSVKIVVNQGELMQKQLADVPRSISSANADRVTDTVSHQGGYLDLVPVDTLLPLRVIFTLIH